MELLYRLLGFAAAVHNTTRLFRINFIPFNLIMMAGLTVLFGVLLLDLLAALASGKTPSNIPLSDLLSGRHRGHIYVTVTGVLHPAAAFTFGQQGGVGTKASIVFVPLTEEGQRNAILVLMNAGSIRALGEQPKRITLTGTVEQIDIDNQQSLLDAGGWIKDFRVNKIYQLNAGVKPGEPIKKTILTVLAAIPLLLLVTTFIMRYLVFRPSPMPLSGMIASDAVNNSIVSRVTGDFTLNNVTKRFQNVPALLVVLESGDFAFISEIDASSSLYGITINKLAGYWLVAMRRYGIQRMESGRYYYGLRACPALRLSFVDVFTGGNSSAVLSFQNEGECLWAMHFLSNPTPTQPAVSEESIV